RDSMELSIRLQSGHLQVRSKTFDQDKNSLAHEDLVAAPEQLVAQITALEPVRTATPRLFASGIVTAGEETAGVSILGIDPASEANAPYSGGLIDGSFLTAGDREGVLMGKSLAEKMNLHAGDQILLLVNTANGDVDEQT